MGPAIDKIPKECVSVCFPVSTLAVVLARSKVSLERIALSESKLAFSGRLAIEQVTLVLILVSSLDGPEARQLPVDELPLIHLTICALPRQSGLLLTYSLLYVPSSFRRPVP